MLGFTGRNAGELCALALVLVALIPPQPAAGQASVGFGQSRPFVVGLIPVVGRGGAVGGVLIDAQGAVAPADAGQSQALREARLAALADLGESPTAGSELRKISLRGLVAALLEQQRKGQPPTSEMQHLAGLVRIEQVFVYPEHHDIVLAGPAEPWQVDEAGNVVGQTSRLPTLQLDDLIVALRAAKAQPATGELISCSIDPTAEGLVRLGRLMKRQGGSLTEAKLAGFEDALGPQQITLTGVPQGSRFARVLVAADFTMKRLGMDFEPAPIDGLPSYLDLLKRGRASSPRGTAPRWWLAPRYEPIARDDEGLAWQLGQTSVQTLTEEGFVGRGGAIVAAKAAKDSPSQKWAEAMTTGFDKLAIELPIFAELRSCMELAVVGALFANQDLPARAGCDLGLLYDERRLAVAEYHVPKTIDSQASLVRSGRESIVSVSGGVEIDSWEVLKRPETRPELSDSRKQLAVAKPAHWWWD